VVDHNPNTIVIDATAVTFSVKCFNPLKLYPLSGNIFRKWFASLLTPAQRKRASMLYFANVSFYLLIFLMATLFSGPG